MLKWVSGVLLVLLITGLWIFSGRAPDSLYRVFPGYFPDPNQWWDESPFVPLPVTQARLPLKVVRVRGEQQIHAQSELGVSTDKQILFGDTHVHTTNSADAFMYSLPLIHGATGAFPPAYACDYARVVSQLDF